MGVLLQLFKHPYAKKLFINKTKKKILHPILRSLCDCVVCTIPQSA